MLKDIPHPKVENIAIAILKEQNEEGETEWSVYLLNMRPEPIEGVLVSSKGYGHYEGREVKTTTLRHYLGRLEANSARKIEPIIDNLFGLNNEYWLSYFINRVMYDKKYVFLPETIKEEHFTKIPILNKQGVMIQ
jgi:hypothetical protein